LDGYCGVCVEKSEFEPNIKGISVNFEQDEAGSDDLERPNWAKSLSILNGDSRQ
jgi:hypothetical protein